MGTNYYAKFEICDSCGRSEEIHLGKSSCGWTFMFQSHDDPPIKSYRDLLDWLDQSDAQIFNEYQEKITVKEFRDIVENRSHPRGLLNYAKQYPDGSFLDPDGNSFSTGNFS